MADNQTTEPGFMPDDMRSWYTGWAPILTFDVICRI
jgi:hypothetical protein